MKKIILLFALVLSSCNPLKDISTEGLTYDGTDVYYKGEICATYSAIEIALDNNKVVREVTYLITQPKFNAQALSIIKLISQKNPNLEVEVELKENR
jgi:thioredoxin reductase